MHKTKNTILIIAAVIIVGCMLYIPGIKDLGLYRDDWNNFYTASVRGAGRLVDHYASDRPVDGFQLSILYRIFKNNITAYHIHNLCCRILGSVFFALALLTVWPRTPKMAGLAGVLAVAFPGFLQQVDGIAYVPHQTAMLCFMASLWLTVLACEPKNRNWQILLTFLSLLFSFANVMLMEYYVGMEIYRFGLIFMMDRERANKDRPQAFFHALLLYLPYLIPALGFVAWRVFFFNAERAGANVMEDLVMPFLTHPRHELLELGVRIAKNVWKLFAGVWTIPAYNLINGLGMKPFLYALIPSLAIFAAGQMFLFLMHRKRTEESTMEAVNESAQWLWYGLICGAIAILPMIIAKRDISFAASLDRFAWVGMAGTILFLAGLLGSLKDRTLRNILTMAAILLAVFVQWQNKTNYINQWKLTKEYWQQLMWRAPMLKQGTTLVSGGTLLVEEDYDIFAPAAMIYYPEVTDWSPIGAEVLNTGTVRDIRLGRKTEREVRKIYVEKDYQQLLAISKPSESGCLRVINGKDPIYSLSDWTKIPEIGAYSKWDQIITDPEVPAAIPFFLGEEPEHGWCYYYEKMELALQRNDPETAAKLADEAAAAGLKAQDNVEWIPVIEAYTETGRTEDALAYAEKLIWDDMMAYSARNYFSAKENAADYQAVIALLSGEEMEAEPSAEDGDEAEGDAPASAEELPESTEETAVPETTPEAEEENLAAAEELPENTEGPAVPETTPEPAEVKNAAADEDPAPADTDVPAAAEELSESTEGPTVSETTPEAAEEKNAAETPAIPAEETPAEAVTYEL